MAKNDDPLKKPSDYPLLRVRVSTVEKFDQLTAEVNRVRTHLQKHEVAHPESKKVWMNNHVIVAALEIGLKELRKKK